MVARQFQHPAYTSLVLAVLAAPAGSVTSSPSSSGTGPTDSPFAWHARRSPSPRQTAPWNRCCPAWSSSRSKRLRPPLCGPSSPIEARTGQVRHRHHVRLRHLRRTSPVHRTHPDPVHLTTQCTGLITLIKPDALAGDIPRHSPLDNACMAAQIPHSRSPTWRTTATLMATHVAARPRLNGYGTGFDQPLSSNNKGSDQQIRWPMGQSGRRVGLYAGFCTPVPRGCRGDGHPSRAGVATGLVRSTRGLGRAALERPRRSTGVLPLDLAPGGVYLAAQVALGTGGLLHHRFTLTEDRGPRRFAFCGTVPRVASGGR